MSNDAPRAALAAEIERHIGAETAILAEFHLLVDQLPEGPLRVLVNQIGTEEEMHHFLLTTLAEWLRDRPEAAQDDGLADAERSAISHRARLLQEHEQATIMACSALKESLGDERIEIVEALLDALILDSRKHHRLLTALDRIASRERDG